jgi:hypothetical protein
MYVNEKANNEKANSKEKMVVSAVADTWVKDIGKDIDIVVYAGGRLPKHAYILRRGNHKVSFGRFEITSRPPASPLDIKEMEEGIDAAYKQRIFDWAEGPNAFLKSQTNWKALDTIWNSLNYK